MSTKLDIMGHTSVDNQVREIRTGKGLTQQQLADLTGVTRQSVNSIECGRFIPTIDTALRIAVALGRDVGDLFWLKGVRK